MKESIWTNAVATAPDAPDAPMSGVQLIAAAGKPLEVEIFVDMFDLSPDVRAAINAEANAWLDQLEDIERLMAFEDECFAEEAEFWGEEQRHYEEIMNR